MKNKELRSMIMSKIKSKNTKPEIKIKKILDDIGIWYDRWKKGGDFVLEKQKTVLFIHGCFWHGCDIHYNEPKTNISFWKKKFITNRIRDICNIKELLNDKYSVVIIWEHAIKKLNDKRLKQIINFVKNKNIYMEINE